MTFFQPAAQLAVTAINLIPCYPAAGHPGLESPFQHLFTQHRLGRKIDLFGDAGGTAARTILYPILGKIQLPIQQYRAPFAGITKEHSYLCPASSVWFGQRQPKFPIVVVTSFLSSLVSLLLAGGPGPPPPPLVSPAPPPRRA